MLSGPEHYVFISWVDRVKSRLSLSNQERPLSLLDCLHVKLKNLLKAPQVGNLFAQISDFPLPPTWHCRPQVDAFPSDGTTK